MDNTQANMLLLAVIGILLVLLFGSPVHKVRVEVTGERQATGREGESSPVAAAKTTPIRFAAAR